MRPPPRPTPPSLAVQVAAPAADKQAKTRPRFPAAQGTNPTRGPALVRLLRARILLWQTGLRQAHSDCQVRGLKQFCT